MAIGAGLAGGAIAGLAGAQQLQIKQPAALQGAISGLQAGQAKARVAQPRQQVKKQFGDEDIKKVRFLLSKGVDKQRALRLVAQANAQTTPEVKPSFGQKVRDVGEGIVSFAGGLPKVVAELGILDKPAEAVGRGVAKVLGKEFKPKQSFSEMAKGSQVGGDPESKLAEGVETGLDIAGIGSLVAGGAGKLIGKRIAKKAVKETDNILKIIGKPVTSKTLKKAIKAGQAIPQKAGKFGRVAKAGIKADEKILRAANIIQKEIKAPAKEGISLFGQAGDLIENKAKALSKDLKAINIGTMTKSKATIKNSIKDLVNLSDEFRPAELKKINKIISQVDKAKNADELRDIRKAFDDQFSNAVKQATDLLSPSTRQAHRIWMEARKVLNDQLDDIANKFGKEAKQAFKDMNALYEAQQNILSKSADFLKETEGLIAKAAKAGKSKIRKAAEIGILGAVGGKAAGLF